MPFKYTLKLSPTSTPHLYIDQLKELMANDNYLHLMMKKTLLLMKKARLNHIRLAKSKEILLVPEKFLHFERGLDPVTGYAVIQWDNEEIKVVKNNPKLFYAQMLSMYKKLGYNISEKENIEMSKVEELLKLTKKQIEQQNAGR